MNSDQRNLLSIFENTWNSFKERLPAIVTAIIVLVIGVFIIRKLKDVAENMISKRAKDTLVVSFLVNIVAIALSILLVVICLTILGWGSITNKILGGAAVTTFIIGFALKDIGENFLAGIIMAFRRPFRIGDLVEVTGIKGRVSKMTLRETTIKTGDGRDIYVPNGIILKNPLQNYTINDLLRGEFFITTSYEYVEEAMQIIEDVVKSFDKVEKTPAPQAVLDKLNAQTADIIVRYWFSTDEVRAPGAQLRSDIMLKVYKALSDKGVALSEMTTK